MADLTHLFQVGQKVKCQNPDTGRFDPGTVKKTYPDHIIVDVDDVCDHMWYQEGLNLDCVFTEQENIIKQKPINEGKRKE